MSSNALHLMPSKQPAAQKRISHIWHQMYILLSQCLKTDVLLPYVTPAGETVTVWLPDFACRHKHHLVASTASYCQISATIMKTYHNSSGVPTLSLPCQHPTAVHLIAAAGQSLSHLITALKAKTSNIMALSGAVDDWDLQRACSASVPAHPAGQGLRLIKGLQNAGVQQLSHPIGLQPVSYWHFSCMPLTGVTSLASWVVHSAE